MHIVDSSDHAIKQFYAEFKCEYEAFVHQVTELATNAEREQAKYKYTSLILCRLLFLYFLQKQGYLDSDPCYLPHHLQHMRTCSEQPDMFYRAFLLPLFHQGLGTTTRTPDMHALLGNVPYLGGDLFQVHQLERATSQLHIPDEAFDRLFTFFERYQWCLDERQCYRERTITPGILGYILEQHINQQQIGAYYTREDVTHYIASRTIIPYLFDLFAHSQPTSTEPFPCWRLIQDHPDRYVYAAIRNPERQADETSREHAERRAYYAMLRARLSEGCVQHSDDLVTYNLDICRFAQDAIMAVTSPDLLYTLYTSLRALTVLDPTCGSGAFLFAALHVLEPLYEACLDRMRYVTTHVQYDAQLTALLALVDGYPWRNHFIRKTILTHNLYGVDLLEEAATVCKLRLYLALIAQSTVPHGVEPLPAIDRNIRTGNALIGLVQTPELRATSLEEQRFLLDRQLAQDFQVDPSDTGTFQHWRTTHQPFHWSLEFGDILKQGGFSIIIGNPPYVEYYRPRFPYTLRDYETLPCANLYPCVIERSRQLLAPHGRHGMIVPLSAFATKNMTPLLDGFLRWFPQSWLSFYHFRPSMLFSGGKTANIPTVIYLVSASRPEQRFSTHLNKWATEHRHQVFQCLRYSPINIARDIQNTHYYPKFGHILENSIMLKVQQHTCIHHYIMKTTTDSYDANTMYYRSAGGLYWKVFTNFPWPYQTTSNKQCSFQAGYERDVFVAVLNSSLFWWYYTVTFDSFNLKDYMLFGFRFTYPDDPATIITLTTLCQQLMDDFRRHARHLKRGSTGSYTIYARKSKHIIDAIDRVLARHYGLSDDELDFILHYDLKYRLGS